MNLSLLGSYTQEKGPAEILLSVIGNKADLESQRQVQTDIAQEYAASMNASFFEASAKDDINVSTIFIDISMCEMVGLMLSFRSKKVTPSCIDSSTEVTACCTTG